MVLRSIKFETKDVFRSSDIRMFGSRSDIQVQFSDLDLQKNTTKCMNQGENACQKILFRCRIHAPRLTQRRHDDGTSVLEQLIDSTHQWIETFSKVLKEF